MCHFSSQEEKFFCNSVIFCCVRTIQRLNLTLYANIFYCTVSWRARAQLESISFLFLLTKEREKGRREAGRKEEEQLTRRKQAYQTGVLKPTEGNIKKESFYSCFLFQGRKLTKIITNRLCLSPVPFVMIQLRLSRPVERHI